MFTKHLLLHCTVLRAVYLWSLRLHVYTKCEQAHSIAIAKMWLPKLTLRLEAVIWHCKNLNNMLSKAHLLLILTCLINLRANKNVKTLVCYHAGLHAVTVSWQKRFLCLENLATSPWWQDPGKCVFCFFLHKEDTQCFQAYFKMFTVRLAVPSASILYAKASHCLLNFFSYSHS